jgi:hypothetical protein
MRYFVIAHDGDPGTECDSYEEACEIARLLGKLATILELKHGDRFPAVISLLKGGGR